MTPCSRAYSSPSAICFANRESILERNRTSGDPLGERRPLDELHDERANSARFLDAKHSRDIRVVEQGQEASLTLEAGHAPWVRGEVVRDDLDRDVAA
jgi:hypothetical protein